jgi:hypothetical protein
MQCNCMVIVIVKKAEERAQVEVEVESSYVDPFGIDRSQSQRSDDPPSSKPSSPTQEKALGGEARGGRQG